MYIYTYTILILVYYFYILFVYQYINISYINTSVLYMYICYILYILYARIIANDHFGTCQMYFDRFFIYSTVVYKVNFSVVVEL